MAEASETVTIPFPRKSGWRAAGMSGWIPAGGLFIVLGLLVVPPVVTLITTSVVDSVPGSAATTFTLRHFIELFQDPKLFLTTWNSLLFSALSTALSILFGGVVAWVVVRTNAPLRGLAYVTSVLSLGTPYLLHVMAWLFLLGRAGPVNEFLRYLTGNNGFAINVYSMWGMVLIQGMLWSPLVFLLLSATFQRSNAEMEEAARMAGGSVARTVWHISFKLAWPAITGMTLFVFIRNLESFDVPVLVGGPGQIELLTTDIYLSMTEMPPKMAHASAFSLVLIAMLSVVLYFYNRFSSHADRYASVTGKGFRPRLFDLGRYRLIGTGIVVVNFVFVLGLPILVSLWIALSPFIQPMRISALKSLSLDNFAIVLTDPFYLTLGFNTLLVAAGAATAAMMIALVAGWVVVRQWPGGKIVEQLSTIPIVFPGIVVGVALIIIALNLPIPLYDTLELIMLAFIIRFLPYGMRYAHTGVMQIHRELEEAGAMSGAGQWMILRRIVFPLLLPALVSGWVFVFLLSANELSMSVLLAGSNSQVMAVAMYDRWSSGQAVEVFALGLVWSAAMAVAMLVLFLVGRRFLSIFEGGTL